MHIDRIENGIVLDHIQAGNALLIYKSLKLSELDCPIAIITNVQSQRLGKKDILKIEKKVDLDLQVLGFLDKGISVNIIKDSKLVEKKKLRLPREVRGIISCKNPRCITSVEKNIEQVFQLSNEQDATYRCVYCESKFQK